jgi:hypothetical protein
VGRKSTRLGNLELHALWSLIPLLASLAGVILLVVSLTR